MSRFLNAFDKTRLPTAAEALPGRSKPLILSKPHFVSGCSINPPFPLGYEQILFGMGCFWGAERLFWNLPGVYITAVGYAGGHTPNPTYEEVCSGRTGHNETVRVVYDPQKISLLVLLQSFWEGHDPTQGMQQGNDIGTQYRSGIYFYTYPQRSIVENSRNAYQDRLKKHHFGAITTEFLEAPSFYYAEDYHQQYLAKNPRGYCGLAGTNVAFPARAH